VRKSKQTFSIISLPPHPKKNCAMYEIRWKNIVEAYIPQMTIWHIHTACWIPKATNMHL
jgi:hypothetical protein